MPSPVAELLAASDGALQGKEKRGLSAPLWDGSDTRVLPQIGSLYGLCATFREEEPCFLAI
jgi:hypothetical protein